MSLGDCKPQYGCEDLQVLNDRGQSINIHLVALNNDNFQQAVELAELFRDIRTQLPVSDRICEPEFWYNGSADAGNELTSIVALSGNRIIAHLAIKQCEASTAIEILHTAVALNFREHTYAIAAHYSKFLRGLYRKQRWSSATHYILTADASSQVAASRYFRSKETALILGVEQAATEQLYPTSMSSLKQNSFLVMQNETGLPPLDYSVSLFPPPQHSDKIIELYNSLNLQRYWNLAPSSIIEMPLSNPSYSAGIPFDIAVEEKPDLGTHEIRVTPSAVDISHLRAAAQAEREQFFLVALDDQLCPNVCEELEGLGYTFTGIFPEHRGHDYLAFCEVSLEQISKLAVFTDGAVALRDYITANVQKKSSDGTIVEQRVRAGRRAAQGAYV